MNTKEEININLETLIIVLNKMFGTVIIDADCQTQQLQGGTLGDVRLVTGTADTADGRNLQYKVVMKTQKKWERPGDPDSWRREYDLYMSDFNTIFSDSLRWPECYYAKMRDNEMELWLEYIDGVSGEALTVEMMEHAATELGRLQGKVYNQPNLLRDISCLGDTGFMKREHRQWYTQTFTYEFLISEQCRLPGFLRQMLRDGSIQLFEGKSFEYGVLRSRGCDIPEHLKQMLIDIDDRKEEIFNNVKNLPVVLCHRDFWLENIFLSDKKPILID